MAPGPRPVFASLTESESAALLARNHVARVAFIVDGEPDIEPIAYAYADGWIYGRTSPGAKLNALLHSPWVAIEIDEVTGPNDWRCVVVHGTVYFVSADSVGVERQGYEHALEHLRALDRHVLDENDAVPHRRHIFRIHCDRVSGRSATSG
ncbi:MAG TPA: pyridoxamine 5'-phosphate oxidase family protein [Gemmatimonadaceae bacterium]|nr:pyridoxamine 5'-phosphate oxidase family protein [Gemmatimonadaceae bacterium]